MHAYKCMHAHMHAHTHTVTQVVFHLAVPAFHQGHELHYHQRQGEQVLLQHGMGRQKTEYANCDTPPEVCVCVCVNCTGNRLGTSTGLQCYFNHCICPTLQQLHKRLPWHSSAHALHSCHKPSNACSPSLLQVAQNIQQTAYHIPCPQMDVP